MQGGVSQCGDIDFPAIFVRLDHPQVLSFIKSEMEANKMEDNKTADNKKDDMKMAEGGTRTYSVAF